MQIQLTDSAIHTFRLRGVNPALLQARLAAIQHVLGLDFLRQLAIKPITDVGSAAILCERSAILGDLANIAGLRTVARDILADPQASLTSPQGQWLLDLEPFGRTHAFEVMDLIPHPLPEEPQFLRGQPHWAVLVRHRCSSSKVDGRSGVSAASVVHPLHRHADRADGRQA